MTRTVLTLLALTAAALSTALPCLADTMEIARAGSSSYQIVLPARPAPCEKTAASELASYLQKITGASLPVVRENVAEAGKPSIYVGATRAAGRLVSSSLKKLGPDGVLLRTFGDDLVLTGEGRRGTLYAVYSFLENACGVRWWTSTEQTVPRQRTLVVPAQNTVYTPAIRCREAFYRDPLADAAFAVRLKNNGHFASIPPRLGGHYGIIGWCHTFYRWLPPDKYFAAHPEWYSEIGGKRTASGAQLCLTNKEMLAEMTRVVLSEIDKDPSSGIISVSQNDWHGPCQCAACQKIVQEEGSESGPLIRFVNAVAAEVGKKYPDVLVETLAYQYTRKAPKITHPAPNVVVRLCTIECSFAHPLDSPQNKAFADDIRSWSAIAPNLFIWDYVTNFANYLVPQPNMRVLAPNIRFFAANRAIGLFEQGDSATSIGDFVRMRAWVISHLMWDPSLDEHKLALEFLNGYYGAGAGPLGQYVNLVHDAWQRSGGHLSCYNGNHGYLTLDEMNRATDLFEEALAAVKADRDLTERIKRERLVLDHLWLLRYSDLSEQAKAENKPFKGPADGKKAAEDFIREANRWDVRNFSEGTSFAAYEGRLRSLFRPPAPKPAELSKISASDVVDIQNGRFKLFGDGDWVTTVDDASASDGSAARMPGNHTQWAVQYQLTPEALKKLDGPAVVYVVARSESASKDGAAFRVGLYDNAAGQIVTFDVPARRAGNGYITLDLGVHSLRESSYVWVSPVGRGDIDAVFVDRILLAKER